MCVGPSSRNSAFVVCFSVRSLSVHQLCVLVFTCLRTEKQIQNVFAGCLPSRHNICVTMSGKLIHNLKRKRDASARQNEQKDIIAPDHGDTIGLKLRPQQDVTRAKEPYESRKKVKLADSTERVDPDGSSSKYDFLREALLKVNALQAELAALDDNDDTLDEDGYDSGHEEDEEALMAFEAEALGFAVCARETMMFLGAQGLTADNPLVVNLRNQLVGRCGEIPI